MLKAEQTAVINQANVHMVSLRGSEILYFSQFFSSFGTQAALISGFIIGNITQVPGLESGHHFLWIYLFWITSALTFCSAMHVLICSIFISVYGQGLALRGPTGSMIRAVEGMVIEQNSIVSYFGFTVFFLGLNLIGTCGIMMTFPYAIASSVITAGGMIAWYQACLRIYNRFKFTAPTLSRDWDSNSDDDDDDEDFNPSSNHTPRALRSNDDNNNSSRKNSTNMKFKTMTIEGYLTLGDSTTSTTTNNTNTSTNSMIRTKKWSRKYFVLKRGYLFYYTDQDAYQYEPESSINKRPISFTGYSIDIIDSLSKNNEIIFTLILSPQAEDADNQRIWEFRCDTMEELNKWKTAFTDVFGLSSSRINSSSTDEGEENFQLDMIAAAATASNNASNNNNTKSINGGNNHTSSSMISSGISSIRNVGGAVSRRRSIVTVNSSATGNNNAPVGNNANTTM